MADERPPTTREIMILLNSHIGQCALLQKINLGFMGTVLMILVGFAGYTYNQNQILEHQQEATAVAALNAIQTTAKLSSDETVQRLTTNGSK